MRRLAPILAFVALVGLLALLLLTFTHVIMRQQVQLEVLRGELNMFKARVLLLEEQVDEHGKVLEDHRQYIEARRGGFGAGVRHAERERMRMMGEGQ